jgi:predicted outer membrane protein
MGVTLAQPSEQGHEVEAPPPPPKETASLFAQLTGLDDAQLAGAMSALCDRAIRMGQLADSKATGKDVKRFAHDVVTSGIETESKLAAVLARLGTVQRDSPASAEVRTDTGRSMTALQMVSGKDFDRTYLNEQRIEAEAALRLVDLITAQVQSRELGDELQRFRARIETRIRMVRALQEQTDRATF